MPATATPRRRTNPLVPRWFAGWKREYLRRDLLAGLVVWSIVVPQAVAYAQIAGLPPEAGLMAAPGALLAYAWLGTSKFLIVSATTATSAVSAAAVGPLAGGDTAAFAAISAAFAVLCAIVLVVAGLLHLGAVTNLVSKPVMTGFLFGVGLTITLVQLPDLLGFESSSGSFVDQLRPFFAHLADTHALTALVGGASLALLVVAKRLPPTFPSILSVLVLAIVASAVFDFEGHGVEVVGDIPRALPTPTLPRISWDDVLPLLGAAFGVLIVTAEATGVARTLASRDGETTDPNRDLVALGTSNLFAGLSGGFVQSGGASQTAAADSAGAASPFTSVVCAALMLLTGAFLAPLFHDLPQPTLAAIVIVAVSGFLRVDELRRFGLVRRDSQLFALLAVGGVLLLGVLPGLVVTAILSLGYVIFRMSNPFVGELLRDPATGAWGQAERYPERATAPGVLVVRSDGILFYGNVVSFKERVVELLEARDTPPRRLVIDLATSAQLDLEDADVLGELATRLEADGIELAFAEVHARARRVLERSGLAARAATIATTIDDAVTP